MREPAFAHTALPHLAHRASRIAPRALLLVAAIAACGGGGDDDDDGSPRRTQRRPAPPSPARPARSSAPPASRSAARDGEIWTYKRVPFAAPPVGELRFRPPAPPACPAEEQDATRLGPVCPQLDSAGAEDCLHLNIWAPAAAAAPRPVMVWIHHVCASKRVRGAQSAGCVRCPVVSGRAAVSGIRT